MTFVLLQIKAEIKKLIPSIKQIGHLLGKGIIKEKSPLIAGISSLNREYKTDRSALYNFIVIQIYFNSCHKINLRLS